MNVKLGIVLIGRNEGERLKDSLRSLLPYNLPLVYVDSGSGDDSVAFARSVGAEVVALDPATPFTAARARNEGAARLIGLHNPDFIQFLDGDCQIVEGWIAAGLDAMEGNPKLAIVTGWRAELYPDESIYNLICDHEWRRPAGPIIACGGDMMVRRTAFEALGGFNPEVIAAEDDEFCLRIGARGHDLLRLPAEMSLHDADMHRFAQYWQRATRNGHGFAQLGALHGAHLRRERLRAWFYGLVLPLVFLLGVILSPFVSLAVLALYLGAGLRTLRGLRSAGIDAPRAPKFAALLTISKCPNLIGMLRYYLRRARGTAMNIIEYK